MTTVIAFDLVTICCQTHNNYPLWCLQKGDLQMSRKPNEKEIAKLRRVIERQPGQKSGTFARKLNWSREKVARRLVTLNDRGVLFYEDDQGRLYPFDPDKL